MSNILQRIQDAVSRGEIQNPLVLELCDEIESGTVIEQEIPAQLYDAERPIYYSMRGYSKDSPEAEAALEGSKKHDGD